MLQMEVDLNAIRYNLGAVKKRIGTDVMAVVKANAYGHGLLAVAHAVNDIACGFVVADVAEALMLSASGIKKDILVLCGVAGLRKNMPDNIVFSVSSIRDIATLSVLKSPRAALLVNTGMNRLGVLPDGAAVLLKAATMAGISIDSAYTHFIDGEDAALADKQFQSFKEACYGLPVGLMRHCCASNALILPEMYRLSAARIGLAMYGYGAEWLMPAMRVYGEVIELHDVSRGGSVGYGAFKVAKKTRIAVVRAGYGDGYPRICGKAVRHVGYNGMRLRVVGQVCMDMLMVDIADLPVSPGERMYLIGGGVSVEDLAAQLMTIPYEVTTMFNERVKRYYVGG